MNKEVEHDEEKIFEEIKGKIPSLQIVAKAELMKMSGSKPDWRN